MEDGDWQEARRKRWRKTLRNDEQPRWNHADVTTMFVSNRPEESRKDSLKKLFAKYGEVVDVYMAMKRDVNKSPLRL